MGVRLEIYTDFNEIEQGFWSYGQKHMFYTKTKTKN